MVKASTEDTGKCGLIFGFAWIQTCFSGLDINHDNINSSKILIHAHPLFESALLQENIIKKSVILTKTKKETTNPALLSSFIAETSAIILP